MNKKITKMLNGECPQCKSTVGDIFTYIPIVKESSIQVEIVCQNCGCMAEIFGNITKTKFEINI